MALVVDASVTVTWFIEGEITAYTQSILSRLRSEQAYVPAIWPYEVANALLLAERRGRISQARVSEGMQRLNHLPFTVDTDRLGRASQEALALARQLNLTVYDASYIDLALDRGMPIATIDNRMQQAAVKVGLEFAEGT